MNLKSFGCSFIYGSDLLDTVRPPRASRPSRATWPSLYATSLGYNYQNYAQPGSGNLQIAERVLSLLACNELNSIYIIGWTWIDRFDYINSDQWQTIMPIDDNKLAKIYYQNLHSEYRDKLTTLMSIRLTIDTLKEKNIPFIMTYMDDLMFDTQWHTTPAVTDLQNYIRSYMTDFDGMTFLEWSKTHHYPISLTGHPLEEAHAAAADYMLQLGIHKV